MLSDWIGKFGDEYTDRCLPNEQALRDRKAMWRDILGPLVAQDKPPRTILEVGTNVGQNLVAIRREFPGTFEFAGVEPNHKARSIAKECAPWAPIHDATMEDLSLFSDGAFDIAISAGVLIHIPPEFQYRAIRELARVSNRYVVLVEYFAPECRMIPYRGEDQMLWLNDFGRLFLEHGSPGAFCLDNGFHWQMTTGIDNTTYWVFEK